MRLVHFYLIGYSALVAGAGITLWQAGVVDRVPGGWLAFTISLVVGLGLLLALTSAKPPVAKHE